VTDPAERSGPFARLLGSLANVLLGVGLPAIRQWLRDRLGPGADVAEVRADGSVVHLEGVVVPVAPGIELFLAAAQATGLPQVRLVGASGVLAFAGLPLRVDVGFAADERDGHERGVWADGELRLVIRHAGGEAFAGGARFRASTGDWALEDGLLENAAGGRGRIRFAAAGSFESGDGAASPTPTRALVPPAIRSAAIALEALPLADVLALGAKALPFALVVAGEVAWDGERGARSDLRIDAGPTGELRIAGRIEVDGVDLDARIDGTVRPSALIRAFEAPAEIAPREEDVVRIDLTARGSVADPVFEGTFDAGEIGLRFGRPRFVPATVFRKVAGGVTATRRGARVRAHVDARRGALTADVEADFPSAAWRATLRGDVDVAFVRDVFRTLGTDPAVRPESGTLTIDLSADREGARGAVSAPELVLAFPFVDASAASATLTGVSVALGVDRTRLAYHDLRFEGHGARFTGEGRVAFDGTSSPVSPLFLRLEEGGADLAQKLLEIFAPSVVPAARGSLPPDLRARGTLDLARGGGLAIDLVVETDAGTTLGVALALAGGAFDGTRLRGALALADARDVALAAGLAAGVADAIRPEGIVALDFALRGSSQRGGLVVAGWLSAPRLGGVAPITELSARVRVDSQGVFWNPVEATVAGGRVVSVGRISFGGDARARAALTGIRVEDLPPIAGRSVGAYVRGSLSAALRTVRPPGGHPRASGQIRLDAADLPGIALASSALERYGLAPPSPQAIGPATATLTSSEWGVTLGDASLDLRGARVRGSFGVSWTGTLDARAEVALEEEYLRTSTLLALPRVLTERLVVPIQVEGTFGAPRLRAEIGSLLGRFLKDNRVTHFVASAVEEAQILLGQTPPSRRPSASPSSAPPPEDAELQAELDAHAADWAEIAERIRRG
jgi:hypothetical protein